MTARDWATWLAICFFVAGLLIAPYIGVPYDFSPRHPHIGYFVAISLLAVAIAVAARKLQLDRLAKLRTAKPGAKPLGCALMALVAVSIILGALWGFIALVKFFWRHS
jgi:hypothetical protein